MNRKKYNSSGKRSEATCYKSAGVTNKPFYGNICPWLRSVAQLVEQRSPKPPVEGSSPSAPAIFFCRGGGMADTLA